MFNFLMTHPPMLYIVIIWILVWKGVALWKSARAGENYWFVALLIINTFGLFEIFYIYLWPILKNKFKSKTLDLSKDSNNS